MLLVIALNSTEVLLNLLKNPLVWVTALTTVAIPVLTAATTRPSTPGAVKTIVSFVLAGVYALLAWLGVLDGDVDWKTALVVFAVAAAGAGGINAAWVSGPLATWLGLKVPINVGPKPLTPEKAAALHSHGLTEVEPVPSNVTASSWENLPRMNPDVVSAERDPEKLAAIKAELEG